MACRGWSPLSMYNRRDYSAANWNVQTSGPWPLNKVHVLTYVVRHKNRSSSIEMAVASWQHERTMKESQCVQTNRRRAGPSEG